MTREQYPSWQTSVIPSGIPERLDHETTRAVILERLARGGGATKWYVSSRREDLPQIAAELRPGSCVSFYFDGRIERRLYDAETESKLLRIIDVEGEVLVGWLGPDGIHLEMHLVSGPLELGELAPEIREAEVYIGAFPARDNDGVNAFTIILPDEDGVVRPHPH